MLNQVMLIDVAIVSAEEHLYTGKATMVVASGVQGELGIPYGHSQLLTALKPGQIRLLQADGTEDVFYVSGGFLEVQPDKVTILADVAVRAADLDEDKAEEALRLAREQMSERIEAQEYAAALADIANASAQLQAIRLLRKRIG